MSMEASCVALPRSVTQRLASAWLLYVVLALGGWGTLPPREPLPVSQALPAEVAATPLARVVAASAPDELQACRAFACCSPGTMRSMRASRWPRPHSARSTHSSTSA